MATITSLGVGTNGLDLESLVSKLVASETIPVTQMQTRTDTLKTQLSSYGKIQSALAAMRDAAAKLTKPDTWGASSATSSDASSVSVTAGSGAAAGNVSVAVTQLATSQTLSSKLVPNSTDALGQGQITIELGKWDTGQTGFTPKSGATAITVDIVAGQDSLSAIRDKINAAGAGVTASVVTDSTGSRLVMRSTATGESNGFRVSVNDADGGSTDSDGLSALAFDPSSSVNSMTQKLAAGNALAAVDGLDINSESNNLSGAVEGLNINLLKVTTGVTLTVAPDKEALKKSITEFVTAYNAMATLFRDQTKYDAANKTAGTLQGDATVIGIQAQMRGIAGGSTALGGAFSRLADIGLDPSTNGTLTLNDSKLSSALAKPEDLKKLFMGLDSGGNSANDGLAQQLRSFGDSMLSTDGRLSSRQSGLQTRISQNDKRTTDLQAHVDLVEKRLRARYSALDVQMGQLNSLSTYVSQQMEQLSNNN